MYGIGLMCYSITHKFPRYQREKLIGLIGNKYLIENLDYPPVDQALVSLYSGRH